LTFATYERNSDNFLAIWSFWKQYNIDQTQMIGWWEDVPVQLQLVSGKNCSTDVLASGPIVVSAFVAYQKFTILTIASWCGEDAQVSLNVDWVSIGLPSHVSVVAPAIDNMQPATVYEPSLPIRIPANLGAILVLSV
jgi:hypothetical protein